MLEFLLSLVSKIPGLLVGPVTQFFTGINISQVLSNIWSAIQFLIKHWKLSLIGLFASTTVFSGYLADKYHTDLIAERVAHQRDINSYKQAQKDAQIKADTERDNLIKESKVRANEADQNYSNLLSKYQSSLLRYKATQGSVSRFQYPSNDPTSQAAPSTDGPGSSSNISITLSDANICAINTARLQAAHDWAIALGKTPNAN